MEVPGCHFTSCLLAREDLRIELIGYREPAVQGDGTRRPMNLLGLTHLCFRVEKADDLAELAERTAGRSTARRSPSCPASARAAGRS